MKKFNEFINEQQVKESNFGQITSIAAAIILSVGCNTVTITDFNGNEREAVEGELFTGEVVKMDMWGTMNASNRPTGWAFVIKTDNEEIEFSINDEEKMKQIREGDTITVKTTGSIKTLGQFLRAGEPVTLENKS